MTLLDLFRRKPKTRPPEPASVVSPGEPAPAPSARPPFAMRSFGLSDRGQVRPDNEDRFAIAELARTLYVHQSNLPQAAARCGRHRGHVFLVADGVGGHEAGE